MSGIKRALLSVSDKTGLIDLGTFLFKKNVELIASGGTAEALKQAGLPVTSVESITSKGEAFGGRMKTISFEIASAILYRRNNLDDVNQAKQLDVLPIDMVVVNLYPFHKTIKNNYSDQECIENIDIGGPTLIRAAAKNFESVTVLCSPDQYEGFIKEYSENNHRTSKEFRQKCAEKVFTMMAFYDLEVAYYLNQKNGSELRYGENPQQQASLLRDPFNKGLAHATSDRGKKMSFNNYLDSDYALKTLKDLNNWNDKLFGCVVVKHNTPCGISMCSSKDKALMSAWLGDEKSSFGGVIATNFSITKQEALFFEGKFVEVVIAPKIDDEAREILKKNCRIIESEFDLHDGKLVKSIEGGLLVQSQDCFDFAKYKQVSKRQFNSEQIKTAEFAEICIKNLKSNAVAICQKTADGFEMVTMGSGQTNRIDCIDILITERLKQKPQTDVLNTVLVSDAFFPFKDSVEAAAKIGIKFIVQPGGSIKDNEVIAEADKHEIAMLFTGQRHFLH